MASLMAIQSDIKERIFLGNLHQWGISMGFYMILLTMLITAFPIWVCLQMAFFWELIQIMTHTHIYIYIIIYNIDIIHPNCGHPMFKSNWDFDQGNLGWILWMVQQWTPCCTPVKGRFKSQKDREPVSL